MRLFIGTTFFSAFIFKKAPGTASSLAIFLLLIIFPPTFQQRFILLGLTIVCHFLCFPFFEKKFNNDDPRVYTLDETIAMIILNFFFYTTYLEWIIAFILFRFFDIIKPFGIRLVEKEKKIPAVFRNVADDILAAIYSFIILTFMKYAL